MWWIFIFSVLVIFGRFTVPGHDVSWPGSYEAMAHVWVTIVGVLGVQEIWRWFNDEESKLYGRASVVSFLLMNAVELYKFALFKEWLQ